jgi:hypothetical protein
MNNVILECPRCLNMFMTSTLKARQVGERTWAARCRCRNFVEFSLDYMDPVNFWAQPNVANRMNKINDYEVRVEGLTYTKSA